MRHILLARFCLETVLFRNLCVNLHLCLCSVKHYASAQMLDFLDLVKNYWFTNQKRRLHPSIVSGWVLAVLCMILFPMPTQANEMDEVREQLKIKIDTVMVLLQDKSVDKTLRDKQIVDIVTPIFDYQTMAKLSLGKKYWPKLSLEKRAMFSDLFIERLQDSFLNKLDIYSDEEILYGEPQTKGKTIHVPSTLISKGNRIGMLYKFYSATEGWKIYDVEIGGVSVIQTYRSQFDGVLSEGTIDDLLEKLKTNGHFVIPALGEEKVKTGSK